MVSERADIELAIYSWAISFLSGNILVQAHFQVANERQLEAEVERRMKAFKPLFRLMANSIVLPDKWKKPTNSSRLEFNKNSNSSSSARTPIPFQHNTRQTSQNRTGLTAGEVLVVSLFLGLPMISGIFFSLRYRTCVLIAAILVTGLCLLGKFFDHPDASRYATYRWGETLETATERNFPPDPRLRDSLIFEKVPRAIGAVLGVAILAVIFGGIYWMPGAVLRRFLRRGRRSVEQV